MKFPKEKLRFASAYGGDVAEEGWLLLDVRNVDLEGVDQLAIRLSDVRELQAKGDRQAAALERARSLLGGEDDE